MKALVTGANGFLGSAVVRALLTDGLAVRAFVRSGNDRRNLEGLDIEPVVGDLTDRESLRRAAAGCNVVFHVAADYRLWVADPGPMYRANVDGSVNVLEAAAAAGARGMVYTSSVAVLGINADRTPADENTPVTLEDMVGHYKRSKFLAEQAVRKRAAELEFPVVTVNPSTPIGPRRRNSACPASGTFSAATISRWSKFSSSSQSTSDGERVRFACRIGRSIRSPWARRPLRCSRSASRA